MLGRLQGAWRELDRDQRLAGLAAIALLATLFLPWYQATVIDRGRATNPTFSAFGVFSFVEAAILLVALGVFALLFARGERRAFHLPGGDGTVIFAAGLWAALLLLWRVFDRPDIERAVSDGVTWGLFFAFVAAGALAAIGWRVRATGRPEPPILRADDGDADYGPRTAATQVTPRRRRPVDRGAVRATEAQLTLDDAAAEKDPGGLPPAAPRREAPGEDVTRRGPRDDDAATRRVPRDDDVTLWSSPDDEDVARRVARERDDAAPRADDPPRPRSARREASPPDPPPPPPFRGVFDQASEDETRVEPREDRPLRPGEIPPAPDR